MLCLSFQCLIIASIVNAIVPQADDVLRYLVFGRTAVPATFLEPIPLENRGLGGKGDVAKGKFLYEKSCLHCHKEGGVTKTVFGDGKGMKNTTWLLGYLSKNNGGSIYYICRKGTAPKKGTMQYMPIYSSEKLSDSQLEDLAAFIVEASKSK